MTEFLRVARATDVPPGSMLRVAVDGHAVALVNVAGEIYAIDDDSLLLVASDRFEGGRFAEDRAPVYLRPNAEVSAALRSLEANEWRLGVFTDAPEALARDIRALQRG